jgi:hypothetical protein
MVNEGIVGVGLEAHPHRGLYFKLFWIVYQIRIRMALLMQRATLILVELLTGCKRGIAIAGRIDWNVYD